MNGTLRRAAQIGIDVSLFQGVKYYHNANEGMSLKEAKDAVEAAMNELRAEGFQGMSSVEPLAPNREPLAPNREPLTIGLDKLREEGVFVQVHVDGLSKLKRATKDAERGVHSKDVRKRLQTAGMTYTIDTDLVSLFHSLENKVRQNLDRWSYDVAGFRPYRLLTWAAGAKWFDKHETLCLELPAIVATAIDRLDARRAYTAKVYAEIAAQTWLNFVRDDTDLIVVDGYAYTDNQEGYNTYEDRVVAEALAGIPTADDLRAIRISYDVAMAQLGSDVLRELNDLDFQRRRRNRAVSAGLGKDASIRNQQRIVAQQDFRNRVVGRAREQAQDTVSPVDEATQALRERTAKSATKVLASIDKNGGALIGSATKAARNMAETFEAMTLGTDTDLAADIALVNNLIDPGNRVDAGPGPSLISALASIVSLADVNRKREPQPVMPVEMEPAKTRRVKTVRKSNPVIEF